jgi:hypothetical protein
MPDVVENSSRLFKGPPNNGHPGGILSITAGSGEDTVCFGCHVLPSQASLFHLSNRAISKLKLSLNSGIRRGF